MNVLDESRHLKPTPRPAPAPNPDDSSDEVSPISLCQLSIFECPSQTWTFECTYLRNRLHLPPNQGRSCPSGCQGPSGQCPSSITTFNINRFLYLTATQDPFTSSSSEDDTPKPVRRNKRLLAGGKEDQFYNPDWSDSDISTTFSDSPPIDPYSRTVLANRGPQPLNPQHLIARMPSSRNNQDSPLPKKSYASRPGNPETEGIAGAAMGFFIGHGPHITPDNQDDGESKDKVKGKGKAKMGGPSGYHNVWELGREMSENRKAREAAHWKKEAMMDFHESTETPAMSFIQRSRIVNNPHSKASAPAVANYKGTGDVRAGLASRGASVVGGKAGAEDADDESKPKATRKRKKATCSGPPRVKRAYVWKNPDRKNRGKALDAKKGKEGEGDGDAKDEDGDEEMK